MGWGKVGLLAVLLCAQSAFSGEFVQEIALPIERTFIPKGYDTNDSVQIVVEGSFPTSCYQIGRADSIVDKEKKIIEVQLTAYEYDGKCLRIPTRFHHTFLLGRMPDSGKYSIVEMTTKRTVGELTIMTAPVLSAGTDDAVYAPLLDGFLQEKGSETQLVLRGVYSNSCLTITDVKLNVDRDVVVVLPFVEFRPGHACSQGEFAFEKIIPVTQTLPAATSYLLHVRSMGGQSINKMVHPRAH